MKTKLMMMAVAVAVAFGAWADTETVGDYTWTYRINGDTAEIYNGGSAAISPEPTGAVTIPSTLGGKPVTSIGYSAFSGCSGLTSVTMEGDCPAVEWYAFVGVAPSCVVRLPRGNSSYAVTDGKWQEMTVEYYDSDPESEPTPEPTPAPTHTPLPETVVGGTVADTTFLVKAQTVNGALY